MSVPMCLHTLYRIVWGGWGEIGGQQGHVLCRPSTKFTYVYVYHFNVKCRFGAPCLRTKLHWQAVFPSRSRTSALLRQTPNQALKFSASLKLPIEATDCISNRQTSRTSRPESGEGRPYRRFVSSTLVEQTVALFAAKHSEKFRNLRRVKMGQLVRAPVKPGYATQPRFESRPEKIFFLTVPSLIFAFSKLDRVFVFRTCVPYQKRHTFPHTHKQYSSTFSE